MAGDHQRDLIGTIGPRDGPGGQRPADTARNIRIAARFPGGYLAQRVPDLLRESGARQRQWRLEPIRAGGKIVGKFGRRLFAQIAELGRADWFISEVTPGPDLAAALKAADVEVLTP